MVAMDSGADNGFFYTSQVMHFSSPFTVFLIYHKHQLLQLIKTTPLEQITITELSIASDIPRKGFYRYFDSIDDVVNFILEKNIQEENEYISRTGVSIDATPREYLIVWLRFWKEKADVMRLFQDRRIHSAMVRHAMRHMDPESASIQQVSMAEPIMVRNLFASYGTMALLEIWNRDNYQITEEAMADFMLELLTQPLFHATIH